MVIGVHGAVEPSNKHLDQSLVGSEELLRQSHVNLAMIGAWAALEAAMRRRLRSAGEKAGWGTPPRQMINELYASGISHATN